MGLLDSLKDEAKLMAAESREPKEEKKQPEVVVEDIKKDEAKVEDSSLKSEDTPAKKEEAQSATPAFNGEEWAKRNKFISPEDFEIRLEEELSKRELSPELKKLKEWQEAGHDITNVNFLRKLNADYSSLNPSNKDDAFKLIQEAMKDANPNMSAEAISERIKLKYDDMFSGDFEPTDKEYRKAQLAFEEDAMKSKSALESGKLVLEKSAPKNQGPTEQETKAYENLVKRGRGQFSRVIKTHLTQNNKIPINIGENKTVEFELTDEEQGRLSEAITSVYDNAPQSFLNEQGLDVNSIKGDSLPAAVSRFARLDDSIFERILSKVSNNSMVEGKVAQIQEKKNASPPEIQTPSKSKEKSKEERASDEIMEKTSHLRFFR